MLAEKILCAIDGSAVSEKAVGFAVHLAKELRQHLTFITVAGDSEQIAVWDIGRIKLGQMPVDKHLAAALNVALKAGIDQVACVRAGGDDIAAAVVGYAETNSYHHIVAGSAGRTGAARLLIGSVAADIVTRAHCPVTVVR
jgi:nucleotide-binding universal stress UspA family protein